MVGENERPSAPELIDFIEKAIVGNHLTYWQRRAFTNWLEFVREGTVTSRQIIQSKENNHIETKPYRFRPSHPRNFIQYEDKSYDS